ncbi:MAG: hypothetical protein E7176_04265 [Erysipelotrichaceae bacterium]|nr:hypothetical protein [Erysipelotrichaceae bacterium]
MKQVLKKIWIVLLLCALINVPMLVVGIYRTDKSATLKGDLTDITSLVEVDNGYKEEGSFSSIYVISFDRPTLLQNAFINVTKSAELDEINPYYTHFTDSESYKMGIVQKNSSLMTAVITAYEAASTISDSIYIDYNFISLCVSFYFEGMPFEIEDEIIAINGIDNSVGCDEFISLAMNTKAGDSVTVKRNKEQITITLTDNLYKMCRWYPYYNINYDNIVPSIKINKTTVGGPSGGLMQTLSIFNRLVDFDYTRGLKIAGTGTMSIDNTVGAIGGIQQKVYTAFDDDVDIFLCPDVHKKEALVAYNRIKYKEQMELVFVKTLEDAIDYLYAKEI